MYGEPHPMRGPVFRFSNSDAQDYQTYIDTYDEQHHYKGYDCSSIIIHLSRLLSLPIQPAGEAYVHKSEGEKEYLARAIR
jgi:hypothetical protein